jgi:hypothetical protein
MAAEELRHRAAYAYHVESGAPVTGEAKTALMALSSKILRSIPVAEYIANRKRLLELAADAPNGFDSPGHDYRRAAAEIKAANHYVPGLVDACDRRLVGKDPGYPEADINAILGVAPKRSN